MIRTAWFCLLVVCLTPELLCGGIPFVGAAAPTASGKTRAFTSPFQGPSNQRHPSTTQHSSHNPSAVPTGQRAGHQPKLHHLPPVTLQRAVVVDDKLVASRTLSQSPAPQHAPLGHTTAMASRIAMLQHAVAAEQAGDSKTAVEKYHKLLCINPRDRHVLISYARLKHRLGDMRGALMTYRQCLRFFPNDPVALNDMGLCQARAGDVDAAIHSLSHAVRAEPRSERYRNNLAIALVQRGERDAALEVLEHGMGPARAHLTLYNIYQQRGDLATATEHIRIACAYDVNMAGAMRDPVAVDSEVEDYRPVDTGYRQTRNLAPEPTTRVVEAAHWNFLESSATETEDIYDFEDFAAEQEDEWRIGDSNP